MDLINRYIHEVGRRLPKRMRADVETELRSLLLDSLEAKLPDDLPESGDVSEDIQVITLQEFGSPRRVARQYNPNINYIIGPRLFEPYLITVAVVLGITLVAHLFGILSLTANLPAGKGLFGEALVGLFHSLQAGLGSITLIFALIERAIPHGNEEVEEKSWDPRKMPKIADHDRIKVTGLIIETIFLLFFLVLLNVFPERVGLSYVRTGGVFRRTSWLAPEFFKVYGPWLSAWWFLSIILNITVLWQGRWQRLTHLLNVALTVFGAYLFYRMAIGPNYIVTAPGGFLGELADASDIINTITHQTIRSVLWVLVATHAYSAGKILYNVFSIQPITILEQK